MFKPRRIMRLFLCLAAVCGACADKPEPVLVPWGAVEAAQQESCKRDPSCVCTLPHDQRPEMIPVPEALRLLNPDIPGEIPNGCQ